MGKWRCMFITQLHSLFLHLEWEMGKDLLMSLEV